MSSAVDSMFTDHPPAQSTEVQLFPFYPRDGTVVNLGADIADASGPSTVRFLTNVDADSIISLEVMINGAPIEIADYKFYDRILGTQLNMVLLSLDLSSKRIPIGVNTLQ